MQLILWQQLNPSDRKMILNRQHTNVSEDLRKTVRTIIQKVQDEGDSALKYYTERFDGIQLNSVQVAPDVLKYQIPLDSYIKNAIDFAFENIQRFHELQRPSSISMTRNEIHLRKEYRSIEKVGLYVPGGNAPLLSTFLMLAIPACIAGCQEIIVTTPPNKEGNIHPGILYISKRCGITQLYQVGGAQAIAAMAYGTESIPKVMKIFGPGNKYVTEAKLQVAQDPNGAALDLPAGPSEVLIIADETANPSFVASDLLAQAEHDGDAKIILVTNSQLLANKVIKEIEQQQQMLGRKNILTQSLSNGLIIITNHLDEAFIIAELYGPEHLMLQIENASNHMHKIRNSGTVFVGHWSSEALGDYASGSNHVLPTYGYAKCYSGLGVESFMKATTFQEVSKNGLLNLAETVETLADLEGLEAHKMSVAIRKKTLQEKL